MIGNTNDVGTLLADPLRFTALYWPDMKLYDKQGEILESVERNHETFVHAANQTGKTRIAALAAIWFFVSRTPARVILSSSSESQLRHVLWREILHLVNSAAQPLPLLVRDGEILKLDGSRQPIPTDYMLATVTNTVESFQGHHLRCDRPRVLAVFDEASAIGAEFFDAADSWCHRKLVMGNPIGVGHAFHVQCKAGSQADPAGGEGLLRKVIHIGALDVPNVQLGCRWKEEGGVGTPRVVIPGLLTYADYLRRLAKWDEANRTVRLDGHFYEGDQALMFPPAWLDQACDPRGWQELNVRQRDALAMGVDVAAGGRDKTCWTIIDLHGIIEQLVLDTPQTMDICGRTIELMRRYGLRPNRVAMDAGGGGKQIGDRLYEQGYSIKLVNFGEGALSTQAYRNRRAEMYARLRERLEPGRAQGCFRLPPTAVELRQELAVMPLSYDSEGRLLLPPKEADSNGQRGPSLRQLLGRSPDRADSLVLAVWALGQYRGAPRIHGSLLAYPQPEDLVNDDYGRPETMSDVYRRVCEELDAEDDAEESCSGSSWSAKESAELRNVIRTGLSRRF